MIPTSVTQLIITLVLVIPGFVYQETRIRLRGRRPSDADTTSRILRAIAGSLLFATLYALVIGPALVDPDHTTRVAQNHPRLAGLAGFMAAFGVPVFAAAFPNLPGTRAVWQWVSGRLPSGLTRYDPRPSAWDVAFEGSHESFVRVRMKDGTWFAGYFGQNSYATSFPDPRSLFVELEYDVADDGTIGDPIEGSVGSVIDCTDAVLVELLASQPAIGAQSS